MEKMKHFVIIILYGGLHKVCTVFCMGSAKGPHCILYGVCTVFCTVFALCFVWGPHKVCAVSTLCFV